MTNTLRLKTNLNCNVCIAAVKPYLDGEPSISRWEVDVASPEKTLTVQGDSVSTDSVKAAVSKAGFNVLGEIAASLPEDPPQPASPVTYYPLVLLVAFLIGVVGLVELAAGSFDRERVMRHFMGGFFLTFSFFKLLDLRGFADSYRMYDVVARRIPAYGYVYPFIELLLGAAYVTGFQPVATNLVTFVVMSVSAVGVVQSLLAKRKIRCACLGAVFNLPMSTVTLVEDALMIVMAAVMLVPGSHDSHALVSQPIPHSQKGSHPMQHQGTHHSHGHSERSSHASLVVQGDSIRQAGQPSTLRLMIHDSHGAMISRFDVLHEKKIHLILVREGLDTFDHVHPQVDPAGNLVVPYTFPVGGTYHLYADNQPTGQEPATASAMVQVSSETPTAPSLTPNVPGRAQGDGLNADIVVEFVGPAKQAMLRFELFDSDGRPVQDLRPYLGAMGHLVVISSDGQVFVHAHPVDRGPHDASNVVAFHANFRNSGLYKGWGQFQRGDAIHVVPFVNDVH